MRLRIEFGYDNRDILAFTSPAYHPRLITALKHESLGQKFDTKRKVWRYPANKLTISWMQRLPQYYPNIELAYSDRLRQHLRNYRDIDDNLVCCRRAVEHPLPKVDGADYMVKPFGHQFEALRFICERWRLNAPYVGLFHQMGTGKTKIVLDAARLLGWKKLLVVCPKTVVISWDRDLVDNVDRYSLLDATAGTGEQRNAFINEFVDDDIYKNTLRVCVVNYDSIWRPFVFEALTSTRWDCIAMDESTYIKSHSAARTKAAMKLREFADFRIIMTGTPVTNNYLDLYSQLQFLDESVIGIRSFTAFKATYAVYNNPFKGKLKHVPILVGYRNIDDLMAKVNLHCLIKTKEECLDLPPVVRTIRSVELDGYPEIQKAYNNIRRELVHVFEHEGDTKQVVATNVLVKLMRLQQITSGYLSETYIDTTGRKKTNVFVLGESPKIQPLVEFVNEIGSAEKVVIWVRFRHDAKQVAHALVGLKCGVCGVVLGGGGKKQDMQNKKILRSFQGEDKYRFLVATPGTCAFGLDMFAARYSVRFSASFKLDDSIQAESRVHRSGQTRQVTYVDLVCKNTVDELVLTALQAKGDLLDYVMAQGSEILKYLPEV